jgi:Colicin V production protein
MQFIADIVILAVLLAAVYVGIARGVFGPVLTEGAFLISFFLDVRVVMPVIGGAVPVAVRTLVGVGIFIVLGVIVRLLLRPVYKLVQRIPVVRAIDEPAGALLHALVAFIVMYVLLGAVLDFDRHVYPTIKNGVATAQALDDLQSAVTQRPFVATMIDPKSLQTLQQQAGAKPIPEDKLRAAQSFIDNYITYIRDPLVNSHLAPLINSIGAKIPFIGHSRPYIEGAKYA